MSKIITELEKEDIIIPEDMIKFLEVMRFGASKYGANGWMEGNHFNLRDNAASMNRHFSEFVVNPKAVDPESGLLHLDHLMCRAGMARYFINKK